MAMRKKRAASKRKASGTRAKSVRRARVRTSSKKRTARTSSRRAKRAPARTIKAAAKRVAVDVALVAGALGKRAVMAGRDAATNALKRTGRAAARTTASALHSAGDRVDSLAKE
jgi:hypothetical protein